MSRFLQDSYLKLNGNPAHKTKLPEEEKNKALFRVVIFCSDILCFAKSDMIAYGNRDIETCTFSDILFAYKTAAGNKTMRSIIKLLYQKTVEPIKV